MLLHPRDPHLARQNPADYIDGLRASVTGALAEAAADVRFRRRSCDRHRRRHHRVDAAAARRRRRVRWRSIRRGTTNLAAHAWLWKDHTSAAEAARITEIARLHAPEYLAPIGGTYSSEWWWSKIWHCLNVAPDVFDAAVSWVELADFVPAVLAGVDDPRDIVRCVCAAGHKAMYSDAWGGLPSKAFLARLDPKLAELRDRLYDKAHPPGRPAGTLSHEWAVDARSSSPASRSRWAASTRTTAPSAPASRTGTLVKIIGTSTCDCAIAPSADRIADIPGICGIVNGSIMPGFFGIEAGQSAVGDILNWWVERVCGGGDALHAQLSTEAAALTSGGIGAAGARLEQRQPHRPGRHAAHRADRRPDASHDPRRDLPRADRSDRIRRARRSSNAFATTACRSTGSSAAAASPRRTICSCRSTPTSSASRC